MAFLESQPADGTELRRTRPGRPFSFANGCGLGSWLSPIPDVKIWHGLSDSVLGLALLAIAGGALTARQGRRPTSRTAAPRSALYCPCRCSR
jgi:hypothetical protein